MKEKNEITGYAEVENGMIYIPKVYMPEGVKLKFRLKLEGEFEIALFLNEAEDDMSEEAEEIECEECYEACKCENNRGDF